MTGEFTIICVLCWILWLDLKYKGNQSTLIKRMCQGLISMNLIEPDMRLCLTRRYASSFHKQIIQTRNYPNANGEKGIK